MQMPEPDQQIIARRESICAALGKLVPADSVVASEEGRRPMTLMGCLPIGNCRWQWCCQKPLNSSPQ